MALCVDAASFITSFPSYIYILKIQAAVQKVAFVPEPGRNLSAHAVVMDTAIQKVRKNVKKKKEKGRKKNIFWQVTKCVMEHILLRFFALSIVK